VRVLVTGASGHVGGAVVDRLAADGHEVVAVSRRGRRHGGSVHVLPADIADPRTLARISAERPCDAIVHAAAVLGGAPWDSEISRVNCLGVQRVLALAERWGCPRFVFTSSIQVIGRPRIVPVDERHPLEPLTAYHASKLFGERMVAIAAGRGIMSSSLRLTSPVGPGMVGARIFSVFVRRARAGLSLDVAGAGSRGQDYVDVRDVADAVALAIQRGLTGVCNVGSGRTVSNRQLAERCVELLGARSELRIGGVPDAEEGVSWEVSIARASAKLGYAPRRSLEDSIRDLASSPAAASRQR